MDNLKKQQWSSDITGTSIFIHVCIYRSTFKPWILFDSILTHYSINIIILHKFIMWQTLACHFNLNYLVLYIANTLKSSVLICMHIIVGSVHNVVWTSI